jgi:hypothetical protein
MLGAFVGNGPHPGRRYLGFRLGRLLLGLDEVALDLLHLLLQLLHLALHAVDLVQVRCR